MDVEKSLLHKKEFPQSDIHTNYQSRFNLPVLNTPQLSRGIFLTFDDFKNNKISYPDFKLKTSKLSTDVTITQNDKEVILTEYWGYYDGKYLFVKPGLVPFRMIRQGNTFDLYGSLRGDTYAYSSTTSTKIGLVTFNNSQSFLPAYPLQVDMETGKVY
jgi:hypothetical protein